MNTTLIKQIQSFLDPKDALISILANINALIMDTYTELNWVGFYFLRNDALVLGPFIVNVACTRLPLNKGVCWEAVNTDTIVNVKDVHTFSGHIACDSNTNSELVVPINYNNEAFAVLDIDSPIINRFSKEMESTFIQVGKLLNSYIEENGSSLL